MDESDLDQYAPLIAKAAQAILEDFHYAEAIAKEAHAMIQRSESLALARQTRALSSH